jgi:hypothetical protein
MACRPAEILTSPPLQRAKAQGTERQPDAADGTRLVGTPMLCPGPIVWGYGMEDCVGSAQESRCRQRACVGIRLWHVLGSRVGNSHGTNLLCLESWWARIGWAKPCKGTQGALWQDFERVARLRRGFGDPPSGKQHVRGPVPKGIEVMLQPGTTKGAQGADLFSVLCPRWRDDLPRGLPTATGLL